MTSSRVRIVLLCLLAASTHADDASWISQRGMFVVSYQSELEPLQINRLHAWILHIEDAAGKPVPGAHIEVSGGMPAHNHGLPTIPRVTKELPGGDYRLDGLRFHMAGNWELTVSIAAAGKTDVVVIKVSL